MAGSRPCLCIPLYVAGMYLFLHLEITVKARCGNPTIYPEKCWIIRHVRYTYRNVQCT